MVFMKLASSTVRLKPKSDNLIISLSLSFMRIFSGFKSVIVQQLRYLQVSVSDALAVEIICRFDHLSEVIAASFLGKIAMLDNFVEQFSTSNPIW